MFDVVSGVLKELGVEILDIFEEEFDMVFGNGGFGWLVVCFIDLLVIMELFVIGYGIYYEYGLFC